MKVILLLLALAIGAIAQDYPKIWTLTGGNQKGIGHGYNIRTMRHSPEPLLDYKSYASSLLVNGQRYAIPYEAYGQGIMRIKFVNESTVYESFQDYYDKKVRFFGISVGLSIYGVGVSVSYNKLSGEIKNLTHNFSRSFSVGEYVWHAFDLEVDYPDVALDPDFIGDVKSLPTTFVADKYRKFIEAYGTHFFTKAAYGCRVNYSLAFDRDMVQKHGMAWSQKQVAVSVGISMGGFGLNVGFGMGKAVNRSAIDGTFQSKSTGVSALLGGDETLFYAGLDVWYPTCVKNREILLDKSKILPIAELLKKADPTRYVAMKLALQDYARNP